MFTDAQEGRWSLLGSFGFHSACPTKARFQNSDLDVEGQRIIALEGSLHSMLIEAGILDGNENVEDFAHDEDFMKLVENRLQAMVLRDWVQR